MTDFSWGMVAGATIALTGVVVGGWAAGIVRYLGRRKYGG